MLKLIVLSIILAVVAVGCGPTDTVQPTDVPDTKSPESNESVRDKVSATQNTAATPSQTRRVPTSTPEEGESMGNSGPKTLSDPDTSEGNHVLTLIPASWLERGVWISHEYKAVQLAGGPHPRTLEEYLDMGEEDRATFFAAFARAFSPSFVTSMRESPPAWKEKFGLDLFSLKSTASVGTTSRFPLSPAVLIGEFSDSEITRKLLNSGYEQKTYKGKAYYAIRKDFGASLRDSPLELNSANRVFVDKEVVAVSPDTAPIEEFLDVTVGETRPLRDNPLALAAFETLGETFVAALLTRTGVFNPVGQTPLTYEKPPDWGNLGPWNILAAGSGVRDGHPFSAFSIVFDDPNAADSNVDEVKARVESYQTIVPQRFPENSVLIEKYPKRPLDEACSAISINALSWTYGSAITLHCQTQNSLLWIQLMDARDLGFLVP